MATDLNAKDRVSGIDTTGGFAYELDLTVPYITTAIHAGHTVRGELSPLMVLSETDRLYEEDTATDRIISDCYSTVWGQDSRAEYDLNRTPDLALPLTPEMFWGTAVYSTPPTDAMNRRSLEKYEAFYRFMAAVIEVLLKRFGTCCIYDVHSYNIQRQKDKGHRSPPVFNLGTRGIDRIKWKVPVDAWLERLGRISLPGQVVTVAENDVFGGLGEFCRRLSSWDSRILVLPTEISKIYMDERSGVVNDPVVDALQREMAAAVADHGREFQRACCR